MKNEKHCKRIFKKSDKVNLQSFIRENEEEEEEKKGGGEEREKKNKNKNKNKNRKKKKRTRTKRRLYVYGDLGNRTHKNTRWQTDQQFLDLHFSGTT